MINHYPKVSIIMGVYNCSNTLAESINSLLIQTYTNWELIICDDGSTDNTYEIAKVYADKYQNILLLSNKKNLGLAFTLNHCLKYASGEYIARQDGDDRSHPERLEKQVSILNQYPEYTIVSTGMRFFDEKGYWGKLSPITNPKSIDFVYQTPFCHAPSMVRKAALIEVNGYNDIPKTLRVEDYDLWFRMYAKGFIGCNIVDPLYEVRDDREAINRRKFKYRINETYVRFNGYRMLNLPLKVYIYVLKPIIVGLIPIWLYKIIRRNMYKEV